MTIAYVLHTRDATPRRRSYTIRQALALTSGYSLGVTYEVQVHATQNPDVNVKSFVTLPHSFSDPLVFPRVSVQSAKHGGPT